ncbi:MAG: glutamate--tRNA ligase [Candidatus Pacearchaeota archaeon]
MKDFDSEIYAYSLENAISHNSAQPQFVLSKLFQHGLKKEDIKAVMPKIVEVVNKVNSMSIDQRKLEFEKYSSFIKKKEENEKTLRDLPNISKRMIFRIAPEPSKHLHIGHALTFIINSLYSEKYHGKLLLRFEDANPEKVTEEFEKSILEDIKDYLKLKISGIRYVSDDIPLLYNYAEKLISLNKAYMCFCSRDKIRSFRHEGKECECRSFSYDKNMREWEKFILGRYSEGKAVLRIKGDMKSLNHVMRDSVIFRAVSCSHYRTGNKYKVWPMYDFYNPIEDSLMGVTHILRSNEFEARIELQEQIKNILNLKGQTIIQYGRFNVQDSTTKGREIREAIKSGEYLSWDDPRLVTLKSLKRRGIVKEVFVELAESLGLTKNQVNLDFDMIAAISRKILDKKANRYSFVSEPVKLSILNAPNIKSIKVKIHPDKKTFRTVKIGEVYISKEDFDRFKKKEVRLMHLYNVILDDKSIFTSMENKNIPKINWVSNPVKVRVMMPDAKYLYGYAEPSIQELKIGEIIQFERFGFCRLDSFDKDKKEFEFWFSHK